MNNVINQSINQSNISNHPATIRRSINGVFLGVDCLYIDDIDKEIANTVLARYYKGLEGDNSNCVVVEYEQ